MNIQTVDGELTEQKYNELNYDDEALLHGTLVVGVSQTLRR